MIKYLFFFLLFFSINCGEAPAGWDGALISPDGSVSDIGDGDGDGDGGEDGGEDDDGDGGEDEPPPPEETKLFQMDVDNMNAALQAYYDELGIDGSTYNYGNLEQSGWCYNPNDGSVSGQACTFTLNFSSAGVNYIYHYQYSFDNSAISGQNISGTFTYNLNYTISGTEYNDDGGSDYELRLNSDFSSGELYYIDLNGAWIDANFGQIILNGTCE